MALIKDYEIPGTGLIAQNAYHVVTNVKIEKRVADVVQPIDNSRADKLTPRDTTPGSEVYWMAGYTAQISVTIWKDKEARENDARPIGFIGTSSSDNKYEASIGTQGMDHKCVFMLEVPSELNHFQQAYRHLLTTDYYSGSLED